MDINDSFPTLPDDTAKKFLSKKNIILLGVVLIAALSIPVVMKLLGDQQVFKSRASSQNIISFSNNATCSGGNCIAINPRVGIEITSPYGPPHLQQPPSAPFIQPFSCYRDRVGVTLSWDSSENSFYLQILDGSSAVQLDVPNIVTKFYDTTQNSGFTLVPNQNYKWQVRAINPEGTSGTWAEGTFECSVPIGVTATPTPILTATPTQAPVLLPSSTVTTQYRVSTQQFVRDDQILPLEFWKDYKSYPQADEVTFENTTPGQDLFVFVQFKYKSLDASGNITGDELESEVYGGRHVSLKYQSQIQTQSTIIAPSGLRANCGKSTVPGASYYTATFNWDAVSNVAGYFLNVYDKDGKSVFTPNSENQVWQQITGGTVNSFQVDLPAVQGNFYRWIISSFDNNKQRSSDVWGPDFTCPSSGAGTPDSGLTQRQFSISLKKGWNLISVPGVLVDPSPSAVFRDSINKVFWFNPESNTWDSPTIIEPGKGYWVETSSDSQLIVFLDPNKTAPPSYDLVKGWNLVGYVDSGLIKPITSVGGYLAGLTFSDVRMYDQVSGFHQIKSDDKVYNSLERGKGYWVNITKAGTMTPP